LELLCADIGGTNARLAIMDGLEIKHLKIYETGKAEGAVPLLKRFSRESGIRLPSKACIAAAGVVEGKRVKGTNIPWDIDCEKIQKGLDIDECVVLNDFEAAAWGLLAVDEKRLVRFGGEKPDPMGTRAILGAGTGLGEAILVHCKSGWKVLRTEGGHSSFSPRNRQGIELLVHLMEKYGHVSFERVLSGSGLWEIYSFFLLGKNSENEEATRESGQLDGPSRVTKLAKEQDEDALDAISFFLGIYGEEASNLALKCLPSGGIYLTGGVTLHLLEYFSRSPFRSSFEEKGRMSPLLEKIPVFVVNEPLLGLLGSAYRLMQQPG